MQLLIVRKPTNFELHGDRVQQNIVRGVWHRQELDRLKITHSQHYEALERLYQNLRARGVDFRSVTRDEVLPKDVKFDAVIAFGGDGTLLSASHHLGEDAKIIGVRSSDASVGYMCAGGMQDIDALVEQLIAGTLTYVDVARLMVKVEHLGRTTVLSHIPVLNDVLYSNANPAATTHYTIKFNGKSESHKSSGIWISTAVGSTAAIQAAGGLKMKLTDTYFQFRVRELYKVHDATLSIVGGAFTPEDDILEFENRNERALLALDGQHGEVPLSFGDRVSFLRAPKLTLAMPQKKWG